MFKLSEIKELIDMLDKSSIEQLEIENEGTRLYMSKPKAAWLQPTAAPAVQQMPTVAPQPAPQGVSVGGAAVADEEVAPEVEQTQEGLVEITSPMVGTFYAAASPGADPYITVGDKVNEQTVVCIVEAMKLMNEIEAEVTGEIVEVLVQNSQLVEFGQPLFLVKPE